MFINQFEVQPGIARRLAGDGGGVIAWLAKLGVHFSSDVEKGGPELVCRTHIPQAAGSTWSTFCISGAAFSWTFPLATGWTASSCGATP